MGKPGEQPTSVLNVAKFLLRNPDKVGVFIGKVLNHFSKGSRDAASAESVAWITANSRKAADIAREIDAALWEEAEAFAAEFRERGNRAVSKLSFEIGGGGDFRFLYWLVRLRRPKVVVETGVAAGWSSNAILAALHTNGHGTLYSSDFPYFRIENPERYIGMLVEPQLREGWKLYLNGDAVALPLIADAVSAVDIFHYDSDKSWSGRDKAVKLMSDKLAPGGLLLMDDIRNNRWFQTYVERHKVPFTIIGGRVGLIGEIKRPD